MEINYRKELGDNYMVIKAGENNSSYAMRIVSENRIGDILPMQLSFMDGETEYYYDINGKLPIESFFSKRFVEAEHVKLIFSHMALITKKLDEYLLDKSSVYLSPQTIFLSMDAKEIYFCFYPDKKFDFNDGIKDIAAFALRKINHQDEESVELAYSLFDIVSREGFAMEDILAKTGACEETGDNAGANEETEAKGSLDDFIMEKNEALSEEKTRVSARAKKFSDDLFAPDPFTKSAKKEDFGDDIFSSKDEDVLPAYEEKPDIKERLLKIAVIAVPVILIIGIAIFLFSDKMSGISVGIKAMCLGLIATAFALIFVIIKPKLLKPRESNS